MVEFLHTSDVSCVLQRFFLSCTLKPIFVTTSEAYVQITNAKAFATPLLSPEDMTFYDLTSCDPHTVISLGISGTGQRSAF